MIHVGRATNNAILICHFCMLGTLARGGSLARSADVPDPLYGRTMRVKNIMHMTWIEMDCRLILSSEHHRVELIAEILHIPAILPHDDIATIFFFDPHSALIVSATKVFK